jgi:sialic acid synthase
VFIDKKDSEEAFVIAEVGQNHQGSLDNAIEYIRIFAQQGADAIKFQTRDNRYLFSQDAYEKEYNSENAFAKTYGEHREKLELEPDALDILAKECKKNNVYFMSTPFDEPSLELLIKKNVEILKIASFDLGNIPFITKISESGLPVVMSIGGGQTDQISSSVEVLRNHGVDLAILHCVSEYPCEYNRLGLGNIQSLISSFPDCAVGSSDHFNGTLSGPVAYMLGARVFEKHVTLNRAWTGTDHSFALEPTGFKNFVRDIKRIKDMLPEKPKDDLGNEFVFQKLGKSIIATKTIKAGSIINLDDLSGRIFNENFVPVRESNKVIGSTALTDIGQGEPVLLKNLKESTS